MAITIFNMLKNNSLTGEQALAYLEGWGQSVKELGKGKLTVVKENEWVKITLSEPGKNASLDVKLSELRIKHTYNHFVNRTVPLAINETCPFVDHFQATISSQAADPKLSKVLRLSFARVYGINAKDADDCKNCHTFWSL